MNRLVLIGMVLVALGAVGFIVPRVTYEKEAAGVNVGPLEIEVEQERSIPIPDLLAGAVLVGGVLLVVIGALNRTK